MQIRIAASVWTSASVIALVVLLAACGGGTSPAPPALVGPTAAPQLTTEAPLATEAPGASSKAAATKKPAKTPTPTKKPAATKKPSTGYYKPPGWDGYSDVDCPDFDTHAHAQSFFVGTGGTKSNDRYRLDANHDGVACESLP